MPIGTDASQFGGRHLASSARSIANPLAGAGRRLAPFVAFALLMAVSLVVQDAQAEINLLRRWLWGFIRVAATTHDPLAVAAAILAAMGLPAIVIVRTSTIIVTVLAIEWALAGPPRSWRTVGYALAMQAVGVSFFCYAREIIGRLWPADFWFSPVILLKDTSLPALLQPLAPLIGAMLILLLTSFADYWSHRVQHHSAFLWRFHAIHHSIEDMDSANSYVHPVDGTVTQICGLVLASLLRFDFGEMLVLGAFLSMHDRLLHSRTPIHTGRFAHIFIDNRHHRIHHSPELRHFNCNYASFFTIWDKLFGTYVHPRTNTLGETGLADRKPPTTTWQFVSGSLAER